MQLTLLTILSKAIEDATAKLINTVTSKFQWPLSYGNVLLKKFRGKIKTDSNLEPLPLWTICTVKLLFTVLNIQLLGGTEFKRGLVLLRCIILSH